MQDARQGLGPCRVLSPNWCGRQARWNGFAKAWARAADQAAEHITGNKARTPRPPAARPGQHTGCLLAHGGWQHGAAVGGHLLRREGYTGDHRCSFVAPEGPAAAPRRGSRQHRASEARTGWEGGAADRGARLAYASVASVPGARGWANEVARAARASRSSVVSRRGVGSWRAGELPHRLLAAAGRSKPHLQTGRNGGRAQRKENGSPNGVEKQHARSEAEQLPALELLQGRLPVSKRDSKRDQRHAQGSRQREPNWQGGASTPSPWGCRRAESSSRGRSPAASASVTASGSCDPAVGT